MRGDDVRSIDWRATARHADPEVPGGMRLVVRTWRPERDRRIVIVVDTGRTSAARIADEPRLDTAFEASLLLAALATRAGDRVDLLVYDRRLRGRVQGATGAELLARMVDTMAGIEPSSSRPTGRSVPGQVRRVTSRHALVVLLTAIDAPGSARGLLSVLPQLTRRHTVVVASVADPALSPRAAAATISTRSIAPPRPSAASSTPSGSAPRSAGSAPLTVTAAPHDLPPALADRYLELKAAGRL